MTALRAEIACAAQARANVFIQGATGVGKELVALAPGQKERHNP
jgi:DNA-binding NtrC family response regulator